MKKYLKFALATGALAACATATPPPSVETGGIASTKTFANSVTPNCVATEFEVYFGADDTRLSPESEKVISAIAQTYSTCTVRNIRVTGFADSVGDPQTNLAVSEARAKLVANALTEAGIITQRFDIEAIGDKGSLTETGLIKPSRRKTVVSIET